MIINLCSSDKLQYFIARSKILVKKNHLIDGI